VTGSRGAPSVTEVLDGLVADDDAAEERTRQFVDALTSHCAELGSLMSTRLDADRKLQVLSALLIMIVKVGMADWTMSTALFQLAERMGFHILPAHFYSPVPNVSRLSDRVWEQNYHGCLDLREDEQVNFLKRISRWSSELSNIPTQPSADKPHLYHTANTQFNVADAVIYYSVIRELRPERVVEIGSGYSTMIAAQAARENSTTRVRCIEPYPMDVLIRGFPGLEQLIQRPVQDVPESEFSALKPGDVLFVDSTHVSKIGSDVNHIVLRILPNLRPGVLVHFHDVFLPWEYPKSWVKDLRLFWNEQYLLLAFLLFNEAFEIVIAGHYLGSRYPDLLHSLFPAVPAGSSGASFWLRRKP
jgi:hypothetical protein